jgi:uncharacterized protein (TIGR02217 family)
VLPPLLLTPWTTPAGLPGLGYPFTRTARLLASQHEFQSGKRARYAWWSYPQYHYSIPFDFLRNNAAEMQYLMAFFLRLSGSVGLFAFADPDDNAAVNCQTGVGDGNTTSFQLFRSIGPVGTQWFDPVFAVTGTPAFFVNGTPVGAVTVANGVASFPSPPAAGAIITWTGTFNWLARFDADTLDVEKWLSTLYRMKSLDFTTEKLIQ